MGLNKYAITRGGCAVLMIVTSNLIQTPKVVTINQNRWSRSVKFTGHDLLEWVVTVDQNTQCLAQPKKMGCQCFHQEGTGLLLSCLAPFPNAGR